MLNATIPSYLYTQFNDDDNLQAFATAFNTLASEYAAFFASIGLPVYTGIFGGLLDWVAQGLYGLSRPSLSFSTTRSIGAINTVLINTLPFNTFKRITDSSNIATTDDIFQRILTWHFYKGDGKTFNIRWLKRRIIRFLAGVNGTDVGTENTAQVSVIISGNNVNIRITPGVRSPAKLNKNHQIINGAPALYNRFGYNATAFNSTLTSFQVGYSLAAAPAFQEAVASGAVELPFQYQFSVAI